MVPASQSLDNSRNELPDLQLDENFAVGDAHNLEKLLETASRLYSLPAVAVQVLHLTQRPDVDAREIRACVEMDPALTSKVLRVVNSSLFGISRPVSDLGQALALLGTKPLKLLVLGFSLPQNLFDNVSRDLLQMYWKRSLIKAVAARELSESVWRLPGDDAFIAGLLDDLGMLVLIQELGEPYVRLVKRSIDLGSNLSELETRVLRFDHRQLSRRLLQRWGLPDVVLNALTAARSPETIRELPLPQRPLPQILHLADLLSLLLTKQSLGVLPDLLNHGQQYHDLTADHFGRMVQTLQRTVDDLGEALSLETAGGQAYAEILAEGYARLSSLAEEVAAGGSKGSSDTAAEESRWLAEAMRNYATPAAQSDKVQSLPPPAAAVPSGPVWEQQDCESESALLDRLEKLVSAARQARQPLSLLLLEVSTRSRADRDSLRWIGLLSGIPAMCRVLEHHGCTCVRVAESRFAVLLAECDRPLGVRLAEQLVRLVQRVEMAYGEAWIVTSVGVASASLPPRNFAASQLLRAADRCLYSAQSCGGNAIKSIET